MAHQDREYPRTDEQSNNVRNSAPMSSEDSRYGNSRDASWGRSDNVSSDDRIELEDDTEMLDEEGRV